MVVLSAILLTAIALLSLLLPEILRFAKRLLYKVPFINYQETQLPIVSINVGGYKCNFLVDTGSSFSFLDKDSVIYTKHRLQKSNGYEVISFGGTAAETSLEAVLDIKLGRTTISDFPISLIPVKQALSTAMESSTPIEGIIGNDMLHVYNFVVDYDKHCIYKI